MLGARFASARAELRGTDPLALPIPVVQLGRNGAARRSPSSVILRQPLI